MNIKQKKHKKGSHWCTPESNYWKPKPNSNSQKQQEKIIYYTEGKKWSDQQPSFIWNHGGQGEWKNTIKMLKLKKPSCQSRTLYSGDMLFKYERRITIFSDKVQLKRFVANISTLEETLKEAFQVEGNYEMETFIQQGRMKHTKNAKHLSKLKNYFLLLFS